MRKDDVSTMTVDTLIVGSGAAAMAAAITAHEGGLKPLMVEKSECWGGSTAVSSGGVWVPMNAAARRMGLVDSIDEVRAYLGRTAPRGDPELTGLFLRTVGSAVEELERTSEMRLFVAPNFPDYDGDSPGFSRQGRMLWPVPYDARPLGRHFATLRSPLRHSMIFGGMVIGVPEMKIFINVFRSRKAAWHVLKRFWRHGRDRMSARRGYLVANGNALAARLGKTVFDRNIPLWLESPMLRLTREGDRVTGAIVRHEGRDVAVVARRGVILATGGAAASPEWRQRQYAHVRDGGEHHSLVPPGATGDALAVTAEFDPMLDMEPTHPVIYLPVSLVPIGKGERIPFPSFTDRAKPGLIAVDPGGNRFTNESASYQEFVPSLLEVGRRFGPDKTHAWLIGDRRAVRKYGIGAVRPFPFPYPIKRHIASGYLFAGRTPEELAERIGVPPAALAATIARYNKTAAKGEDPDFQRGRTAYHRYMGDPEHGPNPCIAPLEGPLYAIKLYAGDAGTTFGLKVDERMQVLRSDGTPIAGMHAVGNDIASIFGGGYPGGGATLGPALAFGYLAGCAVAGVVPRQQTFDSASSDPLPEPTLVANG